MTESDVIDAQAQARLQEWGGAKLLLQMIRLFLENTPIRLEQARKGLDEGNLREAERAVHSLKSSAANVGAMKVSRIAGQMESLAADGDMVSMAGLLPSLESSYAAARERLVATLASIPEPHE